MIWVLKKDGTAEAFDRRKLAAAIWRAMSRTRASYDHAARLAEAIETYIRRSRTRCVSSAAVFEMTLKALKYVGIPDAAESAEEYAQWRGLLRKQLRIRHEGDRLTMWEKSWLFEFAQRGWQVSRRTARIFAGQVEEDLLRSGQTVVHRADVIEALNRMMAEYGLADALPARL